MNLRSEILKEHSKKQCVKIGKWVGKDKARFGELMELFLHDEYRVTQRSAWIISYCADNHPELIHPWLSKMLVKTQEPNIHDAVKRNVFRILAGLDITDIPILLLDTAIMICFDELASSENPIAIKVHAMRALATISKREPDIKGELRDTVKIIMQNAGPGIQSCGRKILKQINA